MELLRDDIFEAAQYGIDVKVDEGRLIAIRRNAVTGNVINYREII